MATRTRRAKRGVPATQEQRDAQRFKAIKAKFNWTNDEWASTWLPLVRMAAVQVAVNDVELQDYMREVVKTGEVPNMLEGWSKLKQHLAALVELTDCALTRSFVVLERLGYSPE